MTFLLYILVPLLAVGQLGMFVWMYHFATKRGLCSRAMYDQLLNELNEHKKHPAGLTLQDIANYLDETYSPMVRDKVQELQDKIDNTAEGVADFVKDEDVKQMVEDKVKEELEKNPPVAVSVPRSPPLPLEATVDLSELDASVAKALYANKLIVRILRELDNVILAVFRDRIREDVQKLQKEADKVLRPLQEAKRAAASELRKNEGWLRRMQASTTDEAQRREAELFCKEKEPELKGSELMKAMMEYLDTRASYMADLEAKIATDKEAFEKAQAALAQYEESDQLARRLQKRQEELQKLDKLADRFADLAKAMDPTSNSVLPTAPVRPPTARPSIPKPTSRRTTDLGGLRATPPPPPSQSSTFGEYEEIDLEDPDVDHDEDGRSSIDLSSLPAPLGSDEGNGS